MWRDWLISISLPGRMLAFIVFLILWSLMLFFVTAAYGQPNAPLLSFSEGGRFEFALVPEVALIRGVPQVVHLGFYQVDPANRWPAGDVERASGWESSRPTQLVDASSGQPVSQFGYGAFTGELTYNGTWSGDVTVRLKEVSGSAQSQPFRIRVLTPTVVYGDNVVAINEQKGWNARLCPSETTSFAACRQKFAGGISDVAPLVVFITPGAYGGQDFYISTRRFSYIVGDPNTRPLLLGDEISGSLKEMFYVANLNMRDSSIAYTGHLTGATNTLIVRSVYQCCETRDQNGIVNPNRTTNTDLWQVYWHASESRSMGSPGNTTHPAYIEGRPKTLFDVNNLRLLGARGSSGVKTTAGTINVRHSLLQVAESLDKIADGVCTHPGYSDGCLTHTPLDFPGFTAATVYGNRFVVWRGPTMGTPPGRSGVLAATIFIRQRGKSIGSDTPNYPNKSWDPPVSSQGQKLQGFCNDWSPNASTFVDEKFWQDVRKVALADPANPCTFKHYIGFNQFQQVPGSLRVIAVRDDGTYPAEATSQFSPTVNILRNHPLWAERSTSFLYGNTYEGFIEGTDKYELDREPNVKYVDPLAFWPRSGANDYPRIVDDLGEELPAWFKL